MKSSPQDFLRAAEFLGAKLSRDAIWAGERCNWFGLTTTDMGTGVATVAHRMCGSDYYGGTSGIAIFLGHLYAATGEKLFRTTAEGAIRQALSRLDHFPRGQRLAFQTGLIGIAHALLELARTCNVEKFKALALLILEEVSRDEIRREDLDVIPGAIRTLVKIHRDHPIDFLMETALRFCELMLENGQSIEQESGSPLALLELYQATGQEKFRHAAERAFPNHQKNLIAATCRADAQGSADDSVALAQSMAGVGMASLRAFEILRKDLYLFEARSVLRSITHILANSPFESDIDFSHARGLSGHADLLIEAGHILQDPNYSSSAETIGALGIDRYKKHDLPWPCGAAGGGETPGLMNGLAGIGYVYLRLYDNSRVPSLLK